ncbi:hypothetical protein cpL17_0618 [Chlamydia pecorum]|nr:hypothetical protein cpL17_0618 [Chlamydia pecorum]
MKKKASLSLFWQEVKLVFSLQGDSLCGKYGTLPVEKFFNQKSPLQRLYLLKAHKDPAVRQGGTSF